MLCDLVVLKEPVVQPPSFYWTLEILTDIVKHATKLAVSTMSIQYISAATCHIYLRNHPYQDVIPTRLHFSWNTLVSAYSQGEERKKTNEKRSI